MKKGVLFLGGGGDADASFAFDEQFFASLPHEANLLYIPIALQRGSIGYESCIDWFAALIERHASGKQIDFHTVLEHTEIKAIYAFDAIYVGGGNTYHLLKYLDETGMKKRLAEYVRNGGCVYGGSAGAIVLGKDLRTAEDENNQGGTNHNGLDLLEGMSILCHYRNSMREKAILFAARLGSVLAIPENSGVIWVENRIDKCVGDVFKFRSDGTSQKL